MVLAPGEEFAVETGDAVARVTAEEEEAAGGESVEEPLVDGAVGGDLDVDLAGAVDEGQVALVVGDAFGEASEFLVVFPAVAIEVEIDAGVSEPLEGLVAVEAVVNFLVEEAEDFGGGLGVELEAD